ncbi:hypothetical protein CTI12_AA351520 [Artemisia annua]|uniref:Cullin family profile domain-containing protein n=1 Tax=Artemisia annua TaxID=35608 RepID=A0A2U1MRZ3_ARTAN|nr:hypothetical protein CTI12_AA351520 [Artemisia annua]
MICCYGHFLRYDLPIPLKALKEAFEIFSNKSVAGSSSVKLLATFGDNILKKVGCEKLNDEAIEDTLKKVVKLLAYIRDKDLFVSDKDLFSECLKDGLDITRDPILIVHDAHYVCGEVRAGLQEETNVHELYVACEI